MENEVVATNKPTERRTQAMTTISVAYLLAPSILFLWMAVSAVINGIQFAEIPRAKEVIARHQEEDEIRKIAAAKIAAGDPIPSREAMLSSLDLRDKRVKALESILTDCASDMQKIGIAVFIGVALQFYVVFRLRAHYRRLAGASTN